MLSEKLSNSKDSTDMQCLTTLSLPVTSAKPADKKSPTPPPRTPKSSGGGFFNFFGGSRKPEPGNKEQEEEAQLPEIEEPRPKG